MALDDKPTKKKPKPIIPANGGMVPPPPPAVTVPQALFPAQPGQMQMPSLDFGQQRVNIPAYDWSRVNALNNTDLSPLKTANSDAQASLKSANDRLAAVPNEQLQYSMPQPTDFENQMQQALQQRFMKAMAGENSFGDRFDRGFDIGQKIAANTIVPALGVFGKGAAGLGALQATEALKNHVHQAEAQRAQSKQALNQSLMNLAAAYENLSPTSAKNAAAHLGQMLQYAQYNRQVQRDAQTDVNAAQQHAATTANNLVNAQQRGGQNEASAYNAGYGNVLGGLRIEQQGGQNNVENQFKGVGAIQKQQEIGIQQQGLTQKAQEEKDKAAQQTTTNNREDKKVQMTAMDQLRKIASDVATKMTVVNGSSIVGQRYPNYAAYLKANPTVVPLIKRYAQMAGLGEFAPEEILKMLPEPVQNPNAQSSGWSPQRFAANVQNTANNAGRLIIPALQAATIPVENAMFGKQQQEQQVRAPQAAPKITVDDAAAFLKKRQVIPSD